MVGESRKTVWLVLMIALLVHFAIAKLSANESPRTALVRTLILDGLTPVEKLADLTLNGVDTLWNNYFALLDIRFENERLKRDNAVLRMEIQNNREVVLEAERMRGLLEAVPFDTGRRLVARVIGSDTVPGRRTVTIDKGEYHGIVIDVPIVTPDGIVGRVIHTGHFASIVQLVSDPESAIGIVTRGSRQQGIVRGNGKELALDLIADGSDLSAGDELLTSGTDRIYPKGLNVGVITSIGPIENLMQSAQIQPAADLIRLEEVLCLVDRSTQNRLTDDVTGRPFGRWPG